MSTKKVSYVKLLKEAIADFDTSKTVDVKGPMADPILSYRGDGELPTHKDAASILERYYFKENNDSGIQVPNLDEAEGPDKNASGTGDPIDNPIDEVPDDNIQKTKKEIEKAIAEQNEKSVEKAVEKDEAEVEDEIKGKGGKEEEELEVEVEESATDSVENAIIEKLIEEMEEEIIDENAEGKATEGAGTEAAGAGAAEKEIPDRKDGIDVKGDTKLEQEILKDIKEGDKGLGPIDPEDQDQDSVEEAFAIFKEQIEEESK